MAKLLLAMSTNWSEQIAEQRRSRKEVTELLTRSQLRFANSRSQHVHGDLQTRHGQKSWARFASQPLHCPCRQVMVKPEVTVCRVAADLGAASPSERTGRSHGATASCAVWASSRQTVNWSLAKAQHDEGSVNTNSLLGAGVNTHHSVRIHLIYCGRWHWEDFTSAGYLHIRKW